MILKNKIVIIILVLLSGFLFSFEVEQQIKLSEKLEHNERLHNIDPEKAYQESLLLLEQAIKEKDRQIELAIYERHCLYFSLKLEIKNLINTAKKLKKKAVEYKDFRYEAVAHVYLLQAYIDNKLYEQAITQYDQALGILNKAENRDRKDSSINLIRAQAYTSMANLYAYLGNYEKAIKNSKLALQEDLRTNNKNKGNRILESYVNLAAMYLEVNIDSSEYYLNKSSEFISSDTLKNFSPYIFPSHVAGDIFRKRENFEQAITNYRIAEEKGYKDPANSEALYKGFIKVYEKTGDTQNLEIYRQKLKDIQLLIYGEKYDSMHLILEDKEDASYSFSLMVIFIVIGVSGLSLAYFYHRNRKKNRLLRQTEERLMEYISRNEELDSAEDRLVDKHIYDELSDIAINNNQMFMAAFNRVFPDFTEKLLKVNPDLVQTEIEFSAYLKLNFTSKEIAQIKTIQLRTVQNRKHRLRKRLNISKNIDIYHWFNRESV